MRKELEDGEELVVEQNAVLAFERSLAAANHFFFVELAANKSHSYLAYSRQTY